LPPVLHCAVRRPLRPTGLTPLMPREHTPPQRRHQLDEDVADHRDLDDAGEHAAGVGEARGLHHRGAEEAQTRENRPLTPTLSPHAGRVPPNLNAEPISMTHGPKASSRLGDTRDTTR
jgi:hypothetical protein